MTKIEDSTKRKPRLVLWPRGAFLFNTRFPGSVADTEALKDSPDVALRLVCYHFYHHRTRTITCHDWLHVATNKIRLSEEVAFAIFVSAQQAAPLEGVAKLSTLEDADPNAKTDLLGLALVVAMLGRQHSANVGLDVAKYMKKHIDAITYIFLLCHYDIALKLITSPSFTPPDEAPEVPESALVNFDLFLEGTIVASKNVSTSDIIPRSFSALMSMLSPVCLHRVGATRLMQSNWFNFQISYQQLVRILWKSLQTDMFSLDRPSRQVRDTRLVTRTITSTQLAEHRKLSLRAWTHLEILTNSVYRGAHLRISHGLRGLSSIVFHIPHARTVEIADCDAVGPIVLGPVSGLLRVSNVRNTRISAICSRIIVEDCEDVTLYVNTPTSPVICGASKRIVLAPYNVYCDALQYELRRAGLELAECATNCWDKPVVLPSPSGSSRVLRNHEVCKLMDPDQFTIQSTPFKQTLGSTGHQAFEENVCTQYLASWKRRRRQAEHRYNSLKLYEREELCPLPADDREYLRKRVASK
ncbi:TBCC domain-containing protein 1-like protein [Aphelenchoides avenae]|nr:TBCC domain-containing protein 1-like protein [Aphelenchus avenae]